MVRVSASLAALAAHPGGSSSSATTTTRNRPIMLHSTASPAAPPPSSLVTHQHHQQQSQQQQQLSLDVTEEQEVSGVGHFTAYADGRVRVLFGDRTILQLDGGRVLARLIMPDGSRREVPVSRGCAFGVEEYVQVCLCCVCI